MKPRTLIFEDDPALRKLLRIVLGARNHEVLDFATPVACALLTEQHCSCPRESACADIVLTDMRMPKMSGLELLQLQQAMGCKALPANKALVSAQIDAAQREELSRLGCQFISKPFRLHTLLQWVEACEKRIAAGRELTESSVIEAMVLKASM